MFNELSLTSSLFLALALLLALGFEFVNGFHDTANAVATVIYTHSLRPTLAVVWSGIWNLIGALTSNGAVAFGVLALLPSDLILNVGSAAGFAMVFAMLLSAMVWNLGTWYLGIPASSSHTLIGSIMGVGLANALLSGNSFGEGVNWSKASEVGLSLLLSPLIGFVFAGILLLLMKAVIRRPELYNAPDKESAPPRWIRSILILTCTGVSFAHGSNDGQKGMGLILLILIAVLPGSYALNPDTNAADIEQIVTAVRPAQTAIKEHLAGAVPDPARADADLSAFLKTTGIVTPQVFAGLLAKSSLIEERLKEAGTVGGLTSEARGKLRNDIYLVAESLGKLQRRGAFSSPDEERPIAALRSGLDGMTKHIPAWVKIAVALALGLGTMVGWERIVVTVGEKIGKTHLSYAQGASAEMVAMATIAAADLGGVPVSTTHVLSSAVAGTMAANRSGLQTQTLRNLLIAWVLTLPVCVTLGAGLFALALNIVLAFGVK